MTPGQAAYEAWCAVLIAREPGQYPLAWEALPPGAREAWDAAAQAARADLSETGHES